MHKSLGMCNILNELSCHNSKVSFDCLCSIECSSGVKCKDINGAIACLDVHVYAHVHTLSMHIISAVGKE